MANMPMNKLMPMWGAQSPNCLALLLPPWLCLPPLPGPSGASGPRVVDSAGGNRSEISTLQERGGEVRDALG